MIRQVKACYADSVVGHPIVDVEAIGCSKIVPPIDAGGKDNIGDGSVFS
jgi:hypothetical protein